MESNIPDEQANELPVEPTEEPEVAPVTTTAVADDPFTFREPAAIGVSFRRSGKVYYFSPNGLKVRQGDPVLTQTDKGVDIGEVVFVKYDVPDLDEAKELKPLLRKATAEDLEKEQQLQLKEREARKVCEQKIIEHDLPMKLIAADYTFDGQRLVFFFSSEGRVDFRNLVRDLAEIFHTRIELRQIGVRDQAKMVGGLGPCGRPLCCNAFLRNFDPVGIRVAKDQGLSLNPAKISGICDRLMCCLRYEHATYTELSRKLPKVGQLVSTTKGPGEVKSVLLMHERLTVQLPGGEVLTLKADQVWPANEEMPEAMAAAVAQAAAQQEEGLGERPAARADLPPARLRQPRPEAPRRREAAPATPAPPTASTESAAPAEEEGETGDRAGKSRRRRRRRGGKGGGAEGAPATAEAGTAPAAAAPQPTKAESAPAAEGQDAAGDAKTAKRRRPRWRPRRKPDAPASGGQ
jgi:cell fate regulator YaaT (PSP1 superfamily)